MRTLFIGGTKRGYLTLKALAEADADLAGIVSLRQHDHESERFEAPIRELAKEYGILHYETRWMKDRDYVRLIAEEIRPDIAFVIGCRILIPEEIYRIPPLGMLVVHDSLLPHYRGFAPLNWAILNGETQTGVTLFYLNERLDGGDIVDQKAVPIGPQDTAQILENRVCQAVVDVVLEAYPLLAQGRASRIKQNYNEGSFTCSRIPEDGVIDWNGSTVSIYNQVRALAYPYPGAFSYYNGKKLMIWKARPVDDAPCYVGRIPGRTVGISRQEGYVDVLTGDGILRILEVQAEGGEPLPAAEVIQSIRSTLGLRLTDLLSLIEELERQLRISHQVS